jgi:hypothetical protein
MLRLADLLEVTTNWRAQCGKSACWFGGRGDLIRRPYLYLVPIVSVSDLDESALYYELRSKTWSKSAASDRHTV